MNLTRDTLNRGTIEVMAEEEFEFPSVDGMKTLIPYSSQWDKIIVQTSGGLGSTLLLYLVAKKFQELKSDVKIQPVTFEIPINAKSLNRTPAIFTKIKELTGYENIMPGLEVKIPAEKSNLYYIDQYFNDTLVNLLENEGFNFELNGKTKNPPEDVRARFPRHNERQDPRNNRTSVYNAEVSASPNVLNDKRGIISLYVKEGVIDDLAPLTLSCDMDPEELRRQNLPIPCGQCWACAERDWAYKSNGLVEKSQ